MEKCRKLDSRNNIRYVKKPNIWDSQKWICDYRKSSETIKLVKIFGHCKSKWTNLKTIILLTIKNYFMKNLMKYSLLLLLISVISCSSNKEEPPVIPCGCDATNVTDNLTNMIGVLKKNSGNFALTYSTASYYIEVGNPPSITTIYFICNDSFLSSIPIQENIPINVVFSGSIKDFCAPPDTILIDTPFNLKLTQISQ